MHVRRFRFYLVCVLCACLSFILSFFVISGYAQAAITDEGISTCAIHITKHPTVLDKTTEKGYYYVRVNIINERWQIPPYCDLPVDWKLEWQILRSDHTVYLENVRSGQFYDTVASATEDFYASSLKYGYFRYRLTVDVHGDIDTTGWNEVSIGSHSSHGGRHRAIIKP